MPYRMSTRVGWEDREQGKMWARASAVLSMGRNGEGRTSRFG